MANYMIRKATLDDCEQIEALIACSARGLSSTDYTREQIEAALLGAFGVDTVLIKDATYFVASAGQMLVGCGGWSKRKTLFGGDRHVTRDGTELDPSTEPAKIRAFFVHPQWARQGIARAILERCESEARESGFRSLELMSTLPGVRLYSACGYRRIKSVTYALSAGVPIEFVQMMKQLPSP